MDRNRAQRSPCFGGWQRTALVTRIAVALACFGALMLAPGRASAAVETLSFTPVADTYVDSSAPGSSFETSRSMYDDASPEKQSFLRFNVSGFNGRPVLGARLRI